MLKKSLLDEIGREKASALMKEAVARAIAENRSVSLVSGEHGSHTLRNGEAGVGSSGSVSFDQSKPLLTKTVPIA